MKMHQPEASWVNRLRAAAFWTAFIGGLAALNGYVMWIDYQNRNIAIEPFRLITNEATSAAGILLMLPFVFAWLGRFPPSMARVLTSALTLAAGGALFSLGHVGIMMILRELTFALAGLEYRHALGDGLFALPIMLAYEMAKDLPTFLGIFLINWVWQQRRKATRATTTHDTPPQTTKSLRRILVRKGHADRAIDIDSIDWLQSSANYVRIFLGKEEYLVRSPLSTFLARLDDPRFVQTHRSFAVNLSRIAEIVPADGGNARIRLEGGAEIPLSRTHSDHVYARLSP